MATRKVMGSIVEQAAATGAANLAEAPGGYRRFFRLSQLSYGTAGTTRKIEDIWATFLKELEDMGIPQESRSRLEALGPKRVFGPKGLGRSLTMGLDKGNFKIVRETLAVAKGATRGHKPALIRNEWQSLLKSVAGDPQFATPDGKRIFAELQKVDPKLVAKVGSVQPMSALAKRGQDPALISMFNKVFKRPGTAQLPAGIVETLTSANAGKLPALSAEAAAGLKAGGMNLGGVGRKIAGIAGKSKLGLAGTAVYVGMEANRMRNILGREGRAKKMALEGSAGMGPSSSADYLRNVIGQQEAVARRQVVMQKLEPDLWQEVVRVLADTGGTPGSLTSTERRIGSDSQIGATRRGRSPEDMKFLLDELFNQMGG